MNHMLNDSNLHHTSMKMFLHGGFQETILFEQWITTSILLFLISCILLFILGILYEGIRQLRQYFEEEHLFNKKIIPDNTNEFELEPMSNNPANKPVPTKSSLQFSTRIWLSGFYVINLAFSYVFMLVIMTFNIYLFISIVLGIGTGYGFYTLISLVPSKNKNKNSI